MPDVSKAQRRLMLAAAHDPKFAKKVGMPTNVAKDFVAADKAAGVTTASLPERKTTRRVRMK